MSNIVKEAAHKYNFISPDEYLEWEVTREERNEYYNGLVIEISGATFIKSSIAVTLIGILGNSLDRKIYKIFPCRMRVSTPSRENYLYPDASIVCGKPELEDGKFDTLTNPSVVFEILSSSTKEADKRRKFFFYMQIPSLKEYIMIDSEKRYTIAARKQTGNSWKFEELNDDATALLIETINFQIPVDELYEGTNL